MYKDREKVKLKAGGYPLPEALLLRRMCSIKVHFEKTHSKQRRVCNSTSKDSHAMLQRQTFREIQDMKQCAPTLCSKTEEMIESKQTMCSNAMQQIKKGD